MATFGSLFAGIGGIDLGLERAGWTGRWQVEYEPWCTRVLERHWPDVTRYGDIRDVDWDGVEPVDLIAGGFPCQPVSTAGRRLIQADDRWLWPEFARAIRELRPRYVLVENVPGLLVGGGMGEVLGDMATLGYDAEWESIPAAAVGAPHLRYRVWIVGTLVDDARIGGGRTRERTVDGGASSGGPVELDSDDGAQQATLADANEVGRRGWPGQPRQGRWGEPANGGQLMANPNGHDAQGFQPEVDDEDLRSLSRSGSPGLRSGAGWCQWLVEPDVGRVAHGVPARVDRLRALGNAVVPQVVEWIGRRILDEVE